MENIRLWATSLCGTLAVTAIFRILVSGSRLEKSVNIFISIFIFLYGILPIKNIETKFDMLPNEYEYNKSNIYIEGYEKIITESINNICKKYNFKISSISINSYIDDNGDYIVNKISIDSDNSDKEIEKIIENELGFEVDVI